MKRSELIALVNFVGMPDEWPQADGRDDELKVVEWDQLAKDKLNDFKNRLRKLKGDDLDFVETEATKLLRESRSENYPYLHRHRQMYLPHVLKLVHKENKRRAAALNPAQEETDTTNKIAEKPKLDRKWYHSSRDLLRRRQLVLQNPRKPAQMLCTVFDSERIGLPEKWETKYKITSWTEAYKNKKVRPLIQKLISTDKKKG